MRSWQGWVLGRGVWKQWGGGVSPQDTWLGPRLPTPSHALKLLPGYPCLHLCP